MKIFSKIMLMTLLVSCTQNKVSNGQKIFRLGNGSEISGIDPHEVTGNIEHRVISSLFEGLMNPDPQTNLPIPGIAESWELSKDLKVYTFKIRSNAKWSNGEALTANDFVFSWKRLLTPSLGAEYAYMLFPVKNAEDYNKGSLKDFSKVGVVAKSSNILGK